MAQEVQFIDSQSPYAAFNDRAFWVDFLRDSEGADGDPGGTPSRGGRRATTDLTITQNGTPNMSVNIGTGVLYIRGQDDAPTQGFYRYRLVDPENRGIAAADPTNDRRDLVYVRIHDATHNGGDPLDDGAFIEVTTGTPAANPELPDPPVGTVLPIGEVFVEAATTSILNEDITNYDITIGPARRGGLVAADLASNAITHAEIVDRQRLIWLDYKDAMQDFGTNTQPSDWNNLTTDSTVSFADGTGDHYFIWQTLQPTGIVTATTIDVILVCHMSTTGTGNVAYQLSGRNIDPGDPPDQSGGTTITGILTLAAPGNTNWIYHETGVTLPRENDAVTEGSLLRTGLRVARSATEDTYTGSFVFAGILLRYTSDM